MFLINTGKMPVYVHEADKPMLEDPQQKNVTMSCGFPYAYKGTGSTGWSGVVADQL